MTADFFLILWFFLPAGIAITVALFAARFPFLKEFSYPLDFHQKWRGKRVFGEHKTIRGLLTGVGAAIVTVVLQRYIYDHNVAVRSLIGIDYSQIDPIILGGLAGLGAIVGDGLKSFFKRQVGIAEGRSWFPFDQIDHICGFVVFTFFYIRLTFMQYLLLFVVWFGIHLLTSYIGYLLKLKKTPI